MKNKQSIKFISKVVFLNFIIFILAGLNSRIIHASSEMAPTLFYSYDGFAPGAKAMGMGFAFTSVADDPSALYFNPAGLNYLDTNILSITMEAGRQGDLSKDKLFLNDPISNSGLCLLALTSGKGSFSFRPLSDMTIRETNGNDWKTTEIKINAYTISAAHKAENGIMTGLNISYLSGRIAEARIENNVPSTNLSDGHGISLDMGFLGNITKEIALGINFQNLLGNIWW
ncbi:MAG: hypothetical protein NT145_00510, partial [Elusimicrobia bacterium]|nr:hypothetical protein [Elusimicrobiota bacterium]